MLAACAFPKHGVPLMGAAVPCPGGVACAVGSRFGLVVEPLKGLTTQRCPPSATSAHPPSGTRSHASAVSGGAGWYCHRAGDTNMGADGSAAVICKSSVCV